MMSVLWKRFTRALPVMDMVVERATVALRVGARRAAPLLAKHADAARAEAILKCVMEATVGQVRTAPHELHPPFLTHPTIAPSLARKISVARPTDALTTRVCGAVDMRVSAHRRVGAVPIWVGAPVDVRSHQEHQVEPPSPASSCHPLVHRMLHALPAAARWFGRMPKVVRISSLPRGPWLRRSRSLLVRRRIQSVTRLP